MLQTAPRSHLDAPPRGGRFPPLLPGQTDLHALQTRPPAPLARPRYQALAIPPPIMVFPIPGCGWCPVIAVVELSNTHRVMSVWLYSAFTTPGIPVWKKVESPIKSEILHVRLRPFQALGNRNGCPHAQAGVAHVQRLCVSKRIAADISGKHRFFPFRRTLLPHKTTRGADTRRKAPEGAPADFPAVLLRPAANSFL